MGDGMAKRPHAPSYDDGCDGREEEGMRDACVLNALHPEAEVKCQGAPRQQHQQSALVRPLLELCSSVSWA